MAEKPDDLEPDAADSDSEPDAADLAPAEPAGRNPDPSARRGAAPLPESLPERFAPVESGPSEPLIIGREQARGPRPAAAAPGRAFVFSDRDGRAVHLAAQPRRFPGLGGARYEWRIEVDTTLRSDTFVAAIPSRTETSRFEVAVDVEWSVTDPVQVVQHGIADGTKIVRPRVMSVLRTVAHGYRIEQVSELEDALTDRLAAECRAYPEGITVHRCYVTADPDERSRAKQELLDGARVVRRVDEEEIAALRSSVNSSSDLFLLYLARDRDRVGALISDMREHETIKENRVIELFNQAVAQNIMQPAEVNEMLRRLLGPITGVFQPGGRTDMFGTQQVPAAAAPPAIEGALADPGSGSGSGGGAGGEADADDEEVMPAELRRRAEDGVDGWRPVPWDS
ncbi:hypothetical protein [Actinomadura sp. 9N215]|uniref:hypothetical protein n=1 Tax=Actinomadura sp. 9N215 TaxID=3375150 RepID=UPI00379A2687